MKIATLLFAVIVLAMGCKQKGSSLSLGQKEDSTHFFQVSHYVQQQIDEVNKTPYYIYRINIKNGSKDSIPINTSTFSNLAESFLQTDITRAEFKKQYIENIFHDQTTQTFTISYSTRNKDLEVQNIEVLLQEDGQTVKRLFIRKFYNYNDSSAIEQLSWKADENFQINRVVQRPGQKETTQQTIVVWNEKV